MMARAARGVLLASLLLAGSAQPGVAQRPSGQRPSDEDRAALERRVRARFAEIIRERLDLSEEAAEELSRTLRTFAEDRRALHRDEAGLRRAVGAFLEAGGRDEARARSLIEAMSALREREAELFKREQEALLQLLTPSQVLRFHGVREELNQRVRRLRGGPSRPGEGRRRPGGSPRFDSTHLR